MMYVLEGLFRILIYWMGFSLLLMIGTIGLGWFRKEEPETDIEENIDEDYI